MNKYKDMMDILHKEASDLVEMNLWHEQLHKEHPARAQRMIDDHLKHTDESDVLQARIEIILLNPLKEPATTREEWAKLKAEAIVKMLKGE